MRWYTPTWYDPNPYNEWRSTLSDEHQQLIKALGLDAGYKSSRPLIDVVIEDNCNGILVRGKLTSEGLKIFEKKMDTNIEKKYTPKKIIVNGPATIVFWSDGTKTIVKCESDHPYANTYDAFTAALAKKIFGTNSHLKNVIERAVLMNKEVKNDESK